VCEYHPRDRRRAPGPQDFSLPAELRERSEELRYGSTSRREFLGLLEAVFFYARNDLLLTEPWRDAPFETAGSSNPYIWREVIWLLAEEGYQPYVGTLLPRDLRPQDWEDARQVAAEMLQVFASDPRNEAYYMEFASRQVVGHALWDVAHSLGVIRKMPRAQQHVEIPQIMPFMCSTWKLYQEIARTRALEADWDRSLSVPWNQVGPLRFQGRW
jgi:hypothetical protein